jgi:hypothetical protein
MMTLDGHEDDQYSSRSDDCTQVLVGTADKKP